MGKESKVKKCKVVAVTHLKGVFSEYQPVIGQVYDAEYIPKNKNHCWEFCVVTIRGKKIVMRHGEFKIVEESQ